MTLAWPAKNLTFLLLSWTCLQRVYRRQQSYSLQLHLLA
jgi:hypothetical protein